MLDPDYNPYDQLQQLEIRIAGLELHLKKIIDQLRHHSVHLERHAEQNRLIAQTLEALCNQNQITNERVNIIENQR